MTKTFKGYRCYYVMLSNGITYHTYYPSSVSHTKITRALKVINNDKGLVVRCDHKFDKIKRVLWTGYKPEADRIDAELKRERNNLRIAQRSPDSLFLCKDSNGIYSDYMGRQISTEGLVPYFGSDLILSRYLTKVDIFYHKPKESLLFVVFDYFKNLNERYVTFFGEEKSVYTNPLKHIENITKKTPEVTIDWWMEEAIPAGFNIHPMSSFSAFVEIFDNIGDRFTNLKRKINISDEDHPKLRMLKILKYMLFFNNEVGRIAKNITSKGV